jgi:hypothetical protein
MSDLMYRKRDSGRMGMLLRFHPSAAYGSSGWVSSVGAALSFSNSKGEFLTFRV